MMARRRGDDTPTPDELREILLAYIDQGEGQHGERRQTAFDRLMDAGLTDRQALAVLDNVIGSLRSTRTGAEGAPLQSDVAVGDGDNLSGVLGILKDLTGFDAHEELSLGGSGNRPARRGKSRLRPQDDGDSDEPVTVTTEGGRTVAEEGDVTSDVAGEITGDDDGGTADLSELGGASPAEARQWLIDNGDLLTESELAEVEAHFTSMQEGGSAEAPDWAELATSVQELREEPGTSVADTEAGTEGQAQADSDFADAWDEAVEEGGAYVADVLGSTGSGQAPDLSNIDQHMPDGLTPTQQQDFINEARKIGELKAIETRQAELMEEGVAETAAQQLAADEVRRFSLLDDTTSPPWLLQFAGGELTDEQKDRYVDYWNDDHGSNLTDFDAELAPILTRMGETTYTGNLTNAVLADQEPLITESIELPFVDGKRRVNYTPAEMGALREMGFSNDAITRLVRLNGIQAGKEAIVPGPDGDTLPIAFLAGLTRYYGGGDEFARQNQAQQERAALEKRLGLRPGEFAKMTTKQRQAFRRRFAGTSNVSGITVTDPRAALVDQLESMERASGIREDRGTLPGVIAANNNFNRGVGMYRGDQVLAFIHAVNPQLAGRIAASGGDPAKMDGQDNIAALSILDRGGLLARGSTPFEQLGGQIGRNILSEVNYFDFQAGAGGGGGGGGGAGPQRRILDPVDVAQRLQGVWSEFNLGSIDDATVSAVVSELQGKLDAAPDGMEFATSAHILDWVKGTARYGDLYGRMPTGMSEKEYRGQFEAGVTDLVGPEGNPEAVRSGMRSGNYQTALGRAAAGPQLRTSSRLRGNWALAKQTLDEFT